MSLNELLLKKESSTQHYQENEDIQTDARGLERGSNLCELALKHRESFCELAANWFEAS